MFEKFKDWLTERFSRSETAREDPLSKTGVRAVIRPKKATVRPRKTAAKPDNVSPDELESNGPMTIEDAGPGKSVLIRNKYVREDTGTHETLKILDDSLVDSGEEPGIDPYNTGGFDRSKNWNNRFRK